MPRKTSTKPRSKSSANSPKRGRGRPSETSGSAASEQGGNRDGSGRFIKGKSGNPGGRPKKLVDMQELAQQHTAAALQRLVEWMQSNDAKASVAAANAILDRAWGKPTQPISNDGDDGFQVNLHEVRSVIASKLARVAAASAEG